MNTFEKWLETEEAKSLEVIDIPEYTQEMEDRQNEIKDKIVEWIVVIQEEKDELDMLQFLEWARKFKVTNPSRALKYYKRAIFEKSIGRGTNIWQIK